MEPSSSVVIQYFNCSSMGTRFDFLTYGLDEGFFASAKTFIINELERIEQKFSRYNDQSEICRINKLAATEPVTTDLETIALLVLCKEYYLKTNKLFDITVGKFTNLADKANQAGDADDSTPTSLVNNIEYANILGADKIIIDVKESTVRFLNPMLAIDLGGIGKGYALEKIKHYCSENRITNALISFGDSSITTLGTHPHGDYWPLGIQHAFLSGTPIHTFRLNDSSMSSSGNTPNNRLKFGTDGHIINPLTGEFQKETKTITVVANSPIDAEVLSTALFIAGDSDKADILSRFMPTESIEISYNQLNDHKIINLNHKFTIIAKKE